MYWVGIFRLQKTLDAMLEWRGALALHTVPAELTNKLKMASLADAKQWFSVKGPYYTGCFQWHFTGTDSGSAWCHLQ